MREQLSHPKGVTSELSSQNHNALRAKIGKAAITSFAIAGLTIGSLTIDQYYSAKAFADTVSDALASYPDKNDACNPQDIINPRQTPTSASPYVSCRYYNWGVPNENGGFNLYSTRGYGYRNCTDWVAYRVNQVSGGNVSLSKALGNAKDWYNNSPANERSSGPRAGEVAVSTSGNYGHVAFIESVSPDGSTMTISEYNYDEDGHGDQRTISTNGNEFTEYIDLGIKMNTVPSSAPPPNPPPWPLTQN